ncbi:MAG: 16S rRNA (cytidine(1402)-2'-O)-methyltransferase [Oligoflexia bacterium]|nr:16S rRNA (cytidine(1402)-2'-O)-methyltransferase [Oligoflexia bacterium]
MSRQEEVKKESSNLIETGIYVIASPIGNLSDLSTRAIYTLKQVDWIAAEDTRVTKKLLNELGLQKTIVSFHEHSSVEGMRKKLIDLVTNKESAAYLSDAGTPGISDPGAELVRIARELAIKVTPIPGPSAISCFLSVLGKPASQFKFVGYAPRKDVERLNWLNDLKTQPGLVLFFESPHRVKSLVEFLSENIPNAFFAYGRELTKKFETVYVGTSKEAIDRKDIQTPKGEYVMAIDFPQQKKMASTEDFEELLTELVRLGLSQKNVIRYGLALGLNKNELYTLTLKIKKQLE